MQPDMIQIAREYFPGWDDDELGFILWNETAYPFNLAYDGREEALRTQLVALRRRLDEDPAYIFGAVSGCDLLPTYCRYIALKVPIKQQENDDPLPAYCRLADDIPNILACLNAHQIRHLVIGAYALAFHGYLRPTSDLDLLLDPEADPIPALSAFGIPDLPATFARDSILRYGASPDRIDFTNTIEGVTFSEAWSSRRRAFLYGTQTHVIGLAALVQNKLTSRRSKDHLDGVWLLHIAGATAMLLKRLSQGVGQHSRLALV